MSSNATFALHPAPFLEVRIHKMDITPSLSGLCVGYEQGVWRAEQFATHLMEWLPEFALKASECQALGHHNAIELIRRAAKSVYKTEKFKNRGEFGELILHAAIRQVFNSLPAISKIYYKSATNDPVKGFDAVHVVDSSDELELWLGEVKFYSDFNRAARDVVAELVKHSERDFLRSEFFLIANKIDDSWPHAKKLKKLLSPNTSLDEVFKRVCMPVLLTYDSQCLSEHKICDEAYEAAFISEINANHRVFAGRALPKNIRIHLFLLPLCTKESLIKALDKELKIWQQL